MKILLVDDSLDTGFLVTRGLNPYRVEQAVSLAEATALLEGGEYNLIMIDVGLPDGNGFAFCDQLSKSGRFDHIPKMFLTAHHLTSDKVYGLNCGADDYVTKPFEAAELKARVDAKLRHVKTDSVIRFHGFELNTDFQRCTFLDGESRIDMDFTPTEYRIFLALLRNEGKPMSRAEIVRTIWKSHGFNIEERGVDTHIAHLRKKMDHLSGWLVSVYGKGYALVPPVSSKAAA